MAIQSFRLDLIIPTFICPIKEGFVFNQNPLIINNITNNNPLVITTSTPHNLNVNDEIYIKDVIGMKEINNNSYFVSSIVSATQFNIKSEFNNNISIDSTKYTNYISGGILGTTNNNINLTDFGVCLSYNSQDFPSNVFYIPDKTLNPTYTQVPLSPKNNNGIQDTGEYYYSFSLSVFAVMVNNALQSSMDDLNAANTTSFEAPYYVYEDDRFNLIVPFGYIADNIEMFINFPLNNFLDGFRTFYMATDDENFKDLKYVIQNLNYTNSYVKKGETLPVPPANPDYLIFRQQYDARFKFNQISSILITSNYIKTRSEFFPKIGNPNSYLNNGRTNNSFNTGTENIISSFDLIDTEGSISWREVQYYQPNIYKWIDLVSDDTLSKVDVNVFFETKKGDILPVYINTNSFNTIRFIFQKIK